MLKVTAQLGYDVITRDTDNYELNGWVDARFVNRGNKPVRIFNDLYQPYETFEARVGNLPVHGTVPVEFDPADTNPRVTVTYGTVRKEC